MNQNLKTDLSLKYLEAEPESSSYKPAPVILFLHGRGANEEDLFDLAPKLNKKYRIICPRAPLQMGLIAFAWFHTTYPNGEPLYDPEEVYQARASLLNFISEIKNKYQVGSDQVFLFGFSQGGILSLGIALSAQGEIAGVAALSCWLPPELIPPSPVCLKGFPLLLSHGTEDEVLPIHYARKAKQILEKTQADLKYFEYPMGHDVTDMNFNDVIRWFNDRSQI